MNEADGVDSRGMAITDTNKLLFVGKQLSWIQGSPLVQRFTPGGLQPTVGTNKNKNTML